MPLRSPDAESQQLAATHQEFSERFKVLELQMTIENQRQRDQVEAALHTLREQLLTMTRETQQQQHALQTNTRDTMDELRKEVAEALHHLSQDVERVGQRAEAHTNRAVERLRHELLETVLQRDHTQEQRQLLGELFVTLGKQLQSPGRGDRA